MKTTQSLAVASSLAFGLFVAGCSQKEPVGAPNAGAGAAVSSSKPDATATSLPVYKNAKGEIICPVTGEVIKSAKDAAGFEDYKGKRYYFCCSMCPPKFKADPDKYVVRHEIEKM